MKPLLVAVMVDGFTEPERENDVEKKFKSVDTKITKRATLFIYLD